MLQTLSQMKKPLPARNAGNSSFVMPSRIRVDADLSAFRLARDVLVGAAICSTVTSYTEQESYLQLNHTRVSEWDGSVSSSRPKSAHKYDKGEIETQMQAHIAFLDRISGTVNDSPISPETATIAKKAWYILWGQSGGTLPVPAAATGPDGQLMYAWDKGRHHLELEFIPGGPAEFFYRDRQDESYGEAEYRVGEDVPPSVIEWMKHFA